MARISPLTFVDAATGAFLKACLAVTCKSSVYQACHKGGGCCARRGVLQTRAEGAENCRKFKPDSSSQWCQTTGNESRKWRFMKKVAGVIIMCAVLIEEDRVAPKSKWLLCVWAHPDKNTFSSVDEAMLPWRCRAGCLAKARFDKAGLMDIFSQRSQFLSAHFLLSRLVHFFHFATWWKNIFLIF